MAFFFSAEFAPFTIALIVMLAIGALELAALLAGLSASSAIDSLLPDLDANAPEASGAEIGPLSSVLSWLSFGRVPSLVALVLGLCGFAVGGIATQFAAQGIFSGPIPAALAAIPGIVAAAYAMRIGGRLLAPLFGAIHSDVASRDDFIGSFATVIRGTARQGAPAEAKTTDNRGNTHYVLIEPSDPAEHFDADTRVFIVSRQDNVYRAITKISSRTS